MMYDLNLSDVPLLQNQMFIYSIPQECHPAYSEANQQ